MRLTIWRCRRDSLRSTWFKIVRLFFTVDRSRRGGIQPLSTVKKSRTTGYSNYSLKASLTFSPACERLPNI